MSRAIVIRFANNRKYCIMQRMTLQGTYLGPILSRLSNFRLRYRLLLQNEAKVKFGQIETLHCSLFALVWTNVKLLMRNFPHCLIHRGPLKQWIFNYELPKTTRPAIQINQVRLQFPDNVVLVLWTSVRFLVVITAVGVVKLNINANVMYHIILYFFSVCKAIIFKEPKIKHWNTRSQVLN